VRSVFVLIAGRDYEGSAVRQAFVTLEDAERAMDTFEIYPLDDHYLLIEEVSLFPESAHTKIIAERRSGGVRENF